MTDEQIIKAADICRTGKCSGCPYHELHTAGCVCELMRDVFDLINRQKKEIEELNKVIQGREQLVNILNKCYQQAKSETIKEFAEALKESADNGGCGEDYVYVSDIDILVKEMTEVPE